ncbi:hypothetical protein [Loktanella sp. Alg231-35]|uniref:hypothetical protein n=1 Tax=Loktanella sp. Alg231-35 TaxID=1922220 RepID=UPI000D54F36C|nr:hypothetical protein [Loktanella sp. Alg231-35]
MKITPFWETNWENSLEQGCLVQLFAGSTDTRVDLKNQSFLLDAASVEMGSLPTSDAAQHLHCGRPGAPSWTAQRRHSFIFGLAAIATRLAVIHCERELLASSNSHIAGNSAKLMRLLQ